MPPCELAHTTEHNTMLIRLLGALCAILAVGVVLLASGAFYLHQQVVHQDRTITELRVQVARLEARTP